MTILSFSDSVVIDSSPEELYDLVSDITRTGQWSPICAECWWNDEHGLRVGAWFTGRNVDGDRTWETRSLVATADRGREFTFLVNGSMVRWSYLFEPAEGGTKLTERWDFLPDGLAFFQERFGEDGQQQIEQRSQAARDGIPATLAAIRKTAEQR